MLTVCAFARRGIDTVMTQTRFKTVSEKLIAEALSPRCMPTLPC